MSTIVVVGLRVRVVSARDGATRVPSSIAFAVANHAMALNAQQNMLPVAQPVYPVQGAAAAGAASLSTAKAQVVHAADDDAAAAAVMMQPGGPDDANAAWRAPTQVIVIQQQPAGPPPINIDRNDPDYLDAADVAELLAQCCCSGLSVCSQFDAINPDEIGTPGYAGWASVAATTVRPSYQRVGPRRWGHR